MTTIAAIPFVFLSIHLLYSDQANDSLFETSGYPKLGDIPILNRKIFKGVRVAIREHPYVVSIRRQCAHILTGTLISRNLVLTVAHPIYNVPIHELGVVAGENYADRGTTLFTVILLIVHENFNPYTLHHDIAILQIYEDAAMKTSVKIIGFVSSQRSLANKKAFVTGWGRCDITGRELCLPRTSIYYPNELLDPMLRSIVFHITEPNYYCDGYTKQDITLGPGMMCMGEAREANPVTPCLAVPGAPLVVNGYLAGIQSWGFGCGYSNDLPLIYTSIQYYKQYLASGNTLTDMYYCYRIGISTLSNIIHFVCHELWVTFRNEHLKVLTVKDWEEISNGFEKRAHFPLYLGAIDGKHIRIQNFPHTGSMNYNYKHFYSLVLLAVDDADYKFIYVDIGAYGKDCDSSILQKTEFWKRMKSENLNIPQPRRLPGLHAKVPYVFIGDNAFPCEEHILKDFSNHNLSVMQRVFNYRLHRARRYVECTFGILSNKWRILHRPLNVSRKFSKNIVKATVMLHNIVRQREGCWESDFVITSGSQLLNLTSHETKSTNKTGRGVRTCFANYFMSEAGQLPWQLSKIEWIMHNRDIFLALWKSKYTELLEATKAYTSRAWLKETRLITPTSRDFLKDLQQTDLDAHLAKLRGYYYDIRDFVFDGRYHKQKRDIVNTIRQIEAEKHKYNNITTTKKPKGAPFIRADNDNDYNYDDNLENINYK